MNGEIEITNYYYLRLSLISYSLCQKRKNSLLLLHLESPGDSIKGLKICRADK